jgi:hypothetical protein
VYERQEEQREAGDDLPHPQRRIAMFEHTHVAAEGRVLRVARRKLAQRERRMHHDQEHHDDHHAGHDDRIGLPKKKIALRTRGSRST